MSNQSPQEICPLCNLPKSHEGSASLTQWILICSCNQKVDPEQQKKTQNICQKCGKRSIQDRKGSFTQWILRSDLCDCEYPEILKSSIEQTQQLEPAGLVTQEIEPDKDLNISGFPFERFRPMKELGRGASSCVYLSLDKLLNKYVAVKCLYDLSPELAVQFQNEAKLNTKMNHPSIGSVMDVGLSDDSTPYMVLEYFDGISLDKYLNDFHPVKEEIIITLFEQILAGVDYAHSKGILHRDIKPANIIVAKNDLGELQAKIIDFGSSTFEQSDVNSDSNSFSGTPSYMAPDKPQGYSYSEQSEVYSIGCVLMELLSGTPPFQGDSAVEILRKHVDSPIPQVDNRDDLEHLEHFNKIIYKCLQKDAINRYESVQDLLNEFSELDYLKEDSAQTVTTIESSSSVKHKILVGAICSFCAVLLCYFGYIYLSKTTKTNSTSDKNEVADSKSPNSSKVENEQKISNSIDLLKPTIRRKSIYVRTKDKYLSPVDPFAFIDEDLEFLPKKTKRLTLIGCPINGSGFRFLVKRRIKLKNLNLNGTLVTDENLKFLRGMNSLTFLSLSATSISTQGLKNLGKLPLKNLFLSDDKQIDDSSVDVIVGQFNKLEKLSISDQKVTDRGIKKLSQLKKLTKLSIRRTKFTDKSLDLILDIPVKSLIINNVAITDKDLRKFKNNKNLQELTFENCTSITPKEFRKLKRQRSDIKILRTNFEDRTSQSYWKQVINH